MYLVGTQTDSVNIFIIEYIFKILIVINGTKKGTHSFFKKTCQTLTAIVYNVHIEL